MTTQCSTWYTVPKGYRQLIDTYNSILTVQIVSAGMARSGCLKAGELLLGAGEGVHLDMARVTPPSSHHDPVLELYGTSPAENEDDNSMNIYSD